MHAPDRLFLFKEPYSSFLVAHFPKSLTKASVSTAENDWISNLPAFKPSRSTSLVPLLHYWNVLR